MKIGDKCAIENKKIVDGTSLEIVEALKPFISGELSTLKSTVKTAVEMLGSLKLSCDGLPDVKS